MSEEKIINKNWPEEISALAILDSLPDAVFFTDLQMRIIYFNLQAEKITDFRANEACGMYCKDVLKTGICETECIIKKALDADHNIFNIETTIKTATGKTFPALVSASLIKNTAGKVIGYLYSFRDISSLKKVMRDLEISHLLMEKKNTELSDTLEELRKIEGEKRVILDTMHERMSYRDKNMRILWSNKAFAEYSHLPAEEITGRHCYEILHKRSEQCPECPFSVNIIENGKSVVIEHSTPDGRKWFIRGHPVRDAKGEIAGLVEVSTDITELKKAEEEVRLLKQQLEFILGVTNTGIDIIDSEYLVRYVDPEWAKIYGDFLGRKCYEYFMGRDEVCSGCGLSKALETHTTVVSELDLVRENNRPVQVISKPFQSEDGEWLVAEVHVDITERKKVESALRESEEKLEAMLLSIGDPMTMMDRDLNIIWTNTIAQKIFGNDIIGKKCYAAFHRREKPCEPYPCFSMEAFRDGKVHEHDIEVTDKNGKTLYFHCIANVALRDKDGNPSAVIEVSRDTTEHKKLEQQLLQAQKMEAIGQLAGGIAHDFNNLLTVIMGFANLLQMDITKDNPLQNNIAPILKAAKKAADLTQALLAFSRKQIMHPQPVNVHQIIKGIESLLSRIIEEDIELSVIPAGKDLVIMADTNQIEQVLMNLAANARDAMPEGGRLTISTGFMKIDDQYIATHSYGNPGLFAVISVEDTGHGMDSKTRERIFEPFFTTKEVGRGTGLGLAMVYGIIKQHDGYINVYSEPGKGTTFKIYLPLVESEFENTKQDEISFTRGEGETILIAEDDMQVRHFMKTLLEKYGYRVITAIDGEDAIEIFHKNREHIRLVVLDTIMPKKNGKEVYDEIHKVSPDMRTIFTSGYVNDSIRKQGPSVEGLNFIPKPISPSEFLTRVYEALHAR